MKRDRLILLQPGFQDPAFPGQRFYCSECALVEGVLASFPTLGKQIDVQRVPWPRPRSAVIDLIGEANQSLPVLVLADDAPPDLDASVHNGRRFAAGKDAIVKMLSARHGIPIPHP